LNGYEWNSNLIVPRDANYFPGAKLREIFSKKGDNKIAIPLIPIQ